MGYHSAFSFAHLLLHLQYPRPFQLRSISFDWFDLVSRNEVLKSSRVYLNFVGFWLRETPDIYFQTSQHERGTEDYKPEVVNGPIVSVYHY